ncbi:MAG: ribosomal protein S18-alanine N-acetyltransferase [Burkholderiales bacterium]|nr:ribosomal protein S18-alanine N-acetyltransferase [Burkholderiales bacterium]
MKRSPPAAGIVLRPMRCDDLPRVVAVEQGVYGFPWTQGNFVDSLAAGYLAEVLVDDDDHVIGYFVAMPGVDEMHLLNLTVAPSAQRRGHGLALLRTVVDRCRALPAASLLLEVRAGNARARQIYERFGFVEIGRRLRYYPAAHGAREDAVVMRLTLASAAGPDCVGSR